MRSRATLVLFIILLVVIIDQAVKIWIKTHFYLGEDLKILPWFHLYFIENNGMAFGMEFGSKLALTLFRIVAVGFLIWYIARIYGLRSVPRGYLVCLSFVTAGAAGNIFDCVFYGLMFNNPLPPQVASLFPAGGGYAPVFLGRVVDMLYFPLFSFVWPSWMPFVGGEHFLFFQPIFNIADAAISCGIIVLVLFYHRYILPPKALAELPAR
ncbi:MAG: lipoprotein signal peptidase [Duncaniella sp.]|nr:lipoprotein signal peptidase [Duncaniella sp.]MDE7474295.1 lipoprotein signal peptidase [Duncaniella sp.]